MLPTTYNRIDENKRNTTILMAGFIALITATVWVFGRAYGVTDAGILSLVGITLIITSVINFISYYFSSSIALSISGATEIKKEDNPELFNLVENLCIGLGMPMPKIHLINDTAPNAFATGRDPDHAAVAFTIGIIQKLDRRELEGVIAHELSHIKNYDTRYMTVVVILVGLIAMLADIFLRSLWYGGNSRNNNRSAGSGGGIYILLGIIVAILTPVIAQLLKFAVSRQREYLADASAALLTRNPQGLANALAKISQDAEKLEVANKATAHMYIINPLKDWGGVMNSWFSTHPPVEERIARLRQM